MPFVSRLSRILTRILVRGRNLGPSIGTRQTSGITILDLRGKLIRGELCNALKEQVAGILARRPTERILLNLENVSAIDMTGVGKVVRAFKDTQEHGGDLRLVCPEGEVLRVLRITKLISVFQVFATEAEALASFQ